MGRVVRLVVDSILPHAECGPNDHRKDAPQFILDNWSESLKRYFSAKKHPKVRSGEKDESEVFEKFCRVLEMKNDEIRYSKFFEFFLGLSLTIERNDVFINLMQTLFGV